MGKLDILNTLDLPSRLIRKEVAGESGIRRINRGADTSVWGNFLSASFTGLGKAIGWALEKVIGPALAVSATTVWGWVVGGTIYLLNFNFAATDEELEQRIAQLELMLYSQLGETFGVTLGWVLCGYAPGLVAFKFNEALAMHILKNVNEQALDEILGEIATFIVFVRNYQAQKTFTKLYIAVRALIKNAANGDSDTLAGGIIERFLNNFPGLKEAAKQWGEEGGQSWTIAQYIEEKVESIDNEKLRNFAENALEGFGESCIEAGYVVASSIDSWRMQQKLQDQEVLGEERTIEIFPDRSVKEPWKEGIVLSGRQEVLKPIAVQTLVNHQQLRHKDVGVFLGESIQTFARKLPSALSIRIYWTNRKDGGMGDIVTYCTISNVKRAKLDWELIKRLAGGDNGRLFGKQTVKGFMSDDSRIIIKSHTVQAGINLIKDLATLTDNEVNWSTTNEKLKEGVLGTFYGDEWVEDTDIVYPYKMIVINKYRVLNQAKEGDLGVRGKTQSKEWDIPLWYPEKPPDFDLMIQELLTIPGTNPI